METCTITYVRTYANYIRAKVLDSLHYREDAVRSLSLATVFD